MPEDGVSLELSYWKWPHPHDFISGHIFATVEKNGGKSTLASTVLEKVTLVKAFTQLADYVREYANETDDGVVLPAVFVHRVDISPPFVSQLNAEFVEGLRTDLVSVLRTLQVEPRILRLRRRAPEVKDVPSAEPWTEFGSRVYARLRKGFVESPLSGRWEPLLHTGEQWHVGDLPVDPDSSGQWVTVAVEQLLATDESRFYLPLAWNPKAWISRQDLSDKYDKHKETS